MKFILPFLFLLVSCSNKINNFLSKKMFKFTAHLQKVATNKIRERFFKKRYRAHKIAKKGLDYKTDDLYRANNKKLRNKNGRKKLDKEENKSYTELFLTIGCQKIV